MLAAAPGELGRGAGAGTGWEVSIPTSSRMMWRRRGARRTSSQRRRPSSRVVTGTSSSRTSRWPTPRRGRVQAGDVGRSRKPASPPSRNRRSTCPTRGALWSSSPRHCRSRARSPASRAASWAARAAASTAARSTSLIPSQRRAQTSTTTAAAPSSSSPRSNGLIGASVTRSSHSPPRRFHEPAVFALGVDDDGSDPVAVGLDQQAADQEALALPRRGEDPDVGVGVLRLVEGGDAHRQAARRPSVRSGSRPGSSMLACSQGAQLAAAHESTSLPGPGGGPEAPAGEPAARRARSGRAGRRPRVAPKAAAQPAPGQVERVQDRRPGRPPSARDGAGVRRCAPAGRAGGARPRAPSPPGRRGPVRVRARAAGGLPGGASAG